MVISQGHFRVQGPAWCGVYGTWFRSWNRPIVEAVEQHGQSGWYERTVRAETKGRGQ